MIFLDTESVGFSGPLILIQYKRMGGEYKEYNVWEHPVSETLELIESLLHEDSLVIFNATHDMFVLTKWYAVFSKVQDTGKFPDAQEIRMIEENLDYSKIPCLHANRIFDIYIIMKQTLFSFAVGRGKRPIEIQYVPLQIVKPLKEILERFAVQFPSILFEKYKNKMPGDYWEVSPSKLEGFVNLKLSFSPSLSLKSIIKFLFPDEETQAIEIPRYHMPNEEDEFQPWNNDWPRLLKTHLVYWSSERAKQYAQKDVLYLERLYEFLVQKNLWPKDIHIDSDLAGHVGASKARGFNIDLVGVQKQLQEAEQQIQNIPDTSAHEALTWLREVTPPDFHWLVQNTDTKKTLYPLSKLEEHPKLAERARQLIAQRKARKKIDILRKLKNVGRFHPDFEVSGTLSNRMAGKGGINPQGIIRERDFRALFLLSGNEEHLSGGDFSSQEVTILESVVKDKELSLYIKENPKRIHEFMAECLFGQEVPEYTPSKEEYYQGKQVVYAYVYGAQMPTLARTAKISLEQTQRGIDKFIQKFPGIRKFAEQIQNDFCSMKQPNGLGTQVEWNDPKQYCVSIFGDSRSYILDNRICKFIFNLANNPSKELWNFKGRVFRKNREQSILGATQSALYATAFSIQAENLRTAGNHYIQAPGAKVTKILQHALWQLQPKGVHKWCIQLYNVHDELLCVNNCPNKVLGIVHKTIAALKAFVPLLDIEWKQELNSWAEVKD